MRSLARRFSVLSYDFAVSVNGEEVKRGDIESQFRFPNEGWNSEMVAGKPISWWAGFTADTIKDDDARGFVVMARGKLVQSPWFFDLSGGAYGQHGMQYMVGEVRADFLDEEVDLIATNRQTVAWDHHVASPLREWGEEKVKFLLTEWVDLRKEHNIGRLRASGCAGAASWMVIKPRPERIISSRPSAAAALTGAFCGTMARSSVGDGHK